MRQDMIFLGVKSSIAHASVHWWEASRERAEPGESVIDVFGVRRQRRAVAAPPAGLAAGGLWKTLRPRELSDAHTAPGTRALICSGLDDSHRQVRRRSRTPPPTHALPITTDQHRDGITAVTLPLPAAPTTVRHCDHLRSPCPCHCVCACRWRWRQRGLERASLWSRW